VANLERATELQWNYAQSTVGEADGVELNFHTTLPLATPLPFSSIFSLQRLSIADDPVTTFLE